MKLPKKIKRLRLGWKFRGLRPLWRHRREIGAGALTAAAIGAGFLFNSLRVRQPNTAKS